MMKNKAAYTATEVACGWAGAIIELTLAEAVMSKHKNCKKSKV